MGEWAVATSHAVVQRLVLAGCNGDEQSNGAIEGLLRTAGCDRGGCVQPALVNVLVTVTDASSVTEASDCTVDVGRLQLACVLAAAV